ncbi:MAG: DNA adenine methylase [Archangiaceae bacterium]|nr:DNA adenine methylase [Archangiaceae bacterium]
MSEPRLRAPFPWFGGKSRAAHLVWSAFGDVANYVEPFAGSLAVLLARPTEPGTETVNDIDCYLANFWRAVALDPAAVAAHADWPVNEADLHARHLSLVRNGAFRERMKTEPEFYDPRVAGWWVWGLCSWIGSGWCDPRERGDGRPSQQLPHLGNAGMGVHRKLPHLGNAGMGVFDQLSSRLRRVRVACGDWTRVLGESVTVKHGTTGVLLDPPYSEGADDLYSAHDKSLSAQVREWALDNGTNPALRIALCGYEGEHDLPGWQVVEWKAKGGYGSQAADGNENSARERIWFSPACAKAKAQRDLFTTEAA